MQRDARIFCLEEPWSMPAPIFHHIAFDAERLNAPQPCCQLPPRFLGQPIQNNFKDAYTSFSKKMLSFKGTVPRDIRLQVFSRISFLQAPEYTNRVDSNFFENLPRYSKLKAHHRWQIENIFSQVFIVFLTPLGKRVNILINCFHQIHFKMSAVWNCSHYFPPVSTTRAVLEAKFATGVIIPVVHLDLRISPRIFEIRKWP